MSICIILADLILYKGVVVKFQSVLFEFLSFSWEYVCVTYWSFSLFNFMTVKHEIEAYFRENHWSNSYDSILLHGLKNIVCLI